MTSLHALPGLALCALIAFPVHDVAETVGVDEALVDFLDRNGDGVLDRFEAAEALMFLISESDANGDGAADAQELATFLSTSVAEETAELSEFFVELDADGDERLTEDELPVDFAPMVLAADADGDAAVSLDELLAADDLGDLVAMFERELLVEFEQLDPDGDGIFRLREVPEGDRDAFAELFDALDADGDEALTRAEFLKLVELEVQPASFAVDGTVAVMTGVIGPSTPGRVLELLLTSSGVQTIVMADVPGSLDDDSNLRAARLVRRAGLATHVPEGGEIASGGVDFFQAGVTRTAHASARFGVHSWGGPEGEGADVPRDDPEHEKYLAYCRDMGIPEAFYWYTLEAAPAADVHWMTPDELQRFEMLTE